MATEGRERDGRVPAGLVLEEKNPSEATLFLRPLIKIADTSYFSDTQRTYVRFQC